GLNWFLGKAYDARSVVCDDAEWYLHLVWSHGHCCYGAVLRLKTKQLAKIQGSKDVAVHHHKWRLGSAGEKAQSPRGTERISLVHVVNPHSVCRSVPKMILDATGEIVD